MIKTNNLVCVFRTEDADTGQQSCETVLNDITLHIEKGSFTAVIGPNGSGKSTLAKHFNGILIPSGGSVFVNGIDTRDETRLFDVRKSAGMVFQNPDNQMVAAVVEDDVAFAPENLGVAPDEIRKRVDSCLKAVDMTDFAGYAPDRLSGGQKQRVAIASVLAMNPECIILDESTAMLDPKGRSEVIDTVRTLNRERGMTVILITHFMEEAALADRIIVLSGGKIELDGTPREVFSEHDRLTELGLDVPQATCLADMLNKAGINIPADLISIDECVSELKKLLGGETV